VLGLYPRAGIGWGFYIEQNLLEFVYFFDVFLLPVDTDELLNYLIVLVVLSVAIKEMGFGSIQIV
jgi:hypothetical protein